MQKKLLIPILVVLVLVIMLVVRGCGNKDTSQDNKQDGTQSTQTDTFDNTNIPPVGGYFFLPSEKSRIARFFPSQGKEGKSPLRVFFDGRKKASLRV